MLQDTVEKNKFLLTEFTPTKPHDFRLNDRTKDVQPPMRFKSTRANSVSVEGSNNRSYIKASVNRYIEYLIVNVSSTPKVKNETPKLVTFSERPEDADIWASNRMSDLTTSTAHEIQVNHLEKQPFKTI